MFGLRKIFSNSIFINVIKNNYRNSFVRRSTNFGQSFMSHNSIQNRISGQSFISNKTIQNKISGQPFMSYNSIQNKISGQSFMSHKSVQNINSGQLLVRHYSGDAKFDSSFIIVRVTQKDFENVIDFFRYTYFNGEPTMVAAGLSYKYNPVMEIKLLEGLSQGMSLMAKCRRTGSIVGASINTGLCPWDPDLQEDYANSCTCPRVAEVLRFYAHISRQPKLWEKFHEYKIFEVSYLATDINNQGKGIAYNLVKKSLELGKDMTYTLIRVDSTNIYTSKICRKLQMTMVHEIPYKSYVDCDGKPIFLPPPPHDRVQVFVDLPHTSADLKQKMLSK